MTLFCGAHVPVLKDLSLWVDGNSKITRNNGSFVAPVPNAFSLPHIASCPGSTDVCRASCYVHGLAKAVPDQYAEYIKNSAAIHRILMTRRSSDQAALAFAHYIKGLTSFRWHVSGDVFSARYAEWIIDVCEASPNTEHWIYTRTFSVVSTLLVAQNLTVNLSGDSSNWGRALACYQCHAPRGYGRLRLTYLSQGDAPEEAQILFPDYALRGRALDDPTSARWWQDLSHEQRAKVCPADFFGQSEAHRCGPCKKCL